MTEINIPTSMVKRMLNQNGCNVKPNSVAKFREMLLAYGADISKKATEKATAAKRKTIMPEDLNND